MAGRGMSACAEPVLAAGIRSFTFHGHGTPALHGIDVSFAAATFTAILGPSGSGKSTLGRLLSGWLPPGGAGALAGFLELGGARLDFGGGGGDPRIDPAGWGRQVGFVPQDAAAVLSTVRATVAEELAFGLENAGTDRTAMASAVERTAGLLGLAGLLDRNPAALSGGQLRRLAIGCAVITAPPVLIMDEPFASLDAGGIAELAQLVGMLVAGGTAVVVLSQSVDAPLLEAGRWIVLSDGTVAASGTPAGLDRPGLLPAGIRRPNRHPASGRAGTRGVRPPQVPAPSGGSGPALELRGISFRYPGIRGRNRDGKGGRAVLDGLDLAVHPGEIVAVTGPNGAGKSTLLRQFNGLLRPAGGAVLVGGRDIAGTPVGQVAASVGLLFQHPRDQLFERTVLREVLFGLDRLSNPAGARQRAVAALEAVGLAGAAGEHPSELPASRQRLLALATVLARRPPVLALDEPTIALDGHGLTALDDAVRSAAEAGTAVVLVTHDLDYARSVAHRTLSLDGGRLVGA